MDGCRRQTNRTTIALMAVSIAGVALAALVLRAVHAHIEGDRVRAHIHRGHELAAAGHLERAVVEYRTALLLERDDREAARSLALTLLRFGRLNESESYLRDLLRRDPTDGPLNRGLARIHAARGRDPEARAAYQRAIYGQWPGDAVRARTDTRFELVGYLTRSGAHDEVLAELLRLRAELPAGRTSEARTAAELLAQHGANDLAVETLAAAVVASPRDLDLLARLADHQLKAGRTVDARDTLRRAVRIEGREDLRRRLAVVDRVLILDPTLARLGIVARTRRARLLLDAVLAQTARCADGPELTSLRREVMKVRKGAADAEGAERELALAARIWSASPACHSDAAESRAIAEVLQHLNDAGGAQR